jgi:hypothetical protein
VEDIQKAWIQQNNVRWINQKVSERGDRPKTESKSTINFTSGPYIDGGGKLSSHSIMVAQSLGCPVVTVDSVDDSGVFRELPPLLQSCLALLNNHSSTPLECYSCSNYSHSP